MKDLAYIKQYKLQLYVLGPVHIGSDVKYNQKEYIELRDEYYFPDMSKVYQVIVKKGAREVSKFENAVMNTRKRLDQILKELNVALDGDYGGYKIAKTGYESSGKRSALNDVHAFIKDSYGEPYVPGSSIKGMLRTLAANELTRPDNIFNSNMNLFINRSTNDKEKEKSLKDELNSFFDSISVSDSEPLKLNDLIITGKYDYSRYKDRTNNNPNHIRVYRESLKPKTVINATVSVDTKKKGSKNALLLMDNVKDITQNFMEVYSEKFLDKLDSDLITFKDAKQIVYLGGGAGFWTKTAIEYGDPSRHQKKHNKTRMVEEGVYKLTRAKPEYITIKGKKLPIIGNNDGYYEQGKCILNIFEERE